MSLYEPARENQFFVRRRLWLDGAPDCCVGWFTFAQRGVYVRRISAASLSCASFESCLGSEGGPSGICSAVDPSCNRGQAALAVGRVEVACVTAWI